METRKKSDSEILVEYLQATLEKFEIAHIGDFFDNSEHGEKLFYVDGGSVIDTSIEPIVSNRNRISNYNDRFNKLNRFDKAGDLIPPTLNLGNIEYFSNNIISPIFNSLIKEESYKTFWENQIAIIKKEKGDTQETAKYIEEIQDKIAGAFIYALGNKSATKETDFVLSEGRCNLHFIDNDLPENLDDYKHSYLMVNISIYLIKKENKSQGKEKSHIVENNKIYHINSIEEENKFDSIVYKTRFYYVDSLGVPKLIPLKNASDKSKFEEGINDFKKNSINRTACLSADQIDKAITAYTGHKPETDIEIASSKSMAKQHCMSAITNYYHLTNDEILKVNTKKVTDQIQKFFDNLVPENQSVLKKKSYARGKAEGLVQSLIKNRKDVRYTCLDKPDQLLFQLSIELFAKTKDKINSKYDHYIGYIAESLVNFIDLVKIQDNETLKAAKLLLNLLKPYLEKKAIKSGYELEVKLNKLANIFEKTNLISNVSEESISINKSVSDSFITNKNRISMFSRSSSKSNLSISSVRSENEISSSPNSPRKQENTSLSPRIESSPRPDSERQLRITKKQENMGLYSSSSGNLSKNNSLAKSSGNLSKNSSVAKSSSDELSKSSPLSKSSGMGLGKK